MSTLFSRIKSYAALIIIAGCIMLYLMHSNGASININNDNSRKLKKHFTFELPVWEHETSCSEGQQREECQQCRSRPELWDCVGEDRSWSVVFVDQRPPEKRCPSALRLLRRAEIVVVHDTVNTLDWPPGWHGHRRMFTDDFGTHTSIVQVVHRFCILTLYNIHTG